jgi:Tfp pilus assembly protein PilP
MEERTSLRDAFGTAWNNLTGVNNDGNVKTIRIVFFAIFLAGTGFAGYKFMEGKRMLDELDEGVYSSGTPSPAPADKARLDAIIEQVKVTSQLRESSPSRVKAIENSFGKYPFGDPKFDLAVETVSKDVPLPDFAIEVPQIIIDYPPEGITLRAIMIMGKQQVAVMDIPGVGSGMIVKAGDTFMQKKGRVVRVAPDKVVVNWGGKNWDIAPSF